MNDKTNKVEVLTFRRGATVATVATNGKRSVSQCGERVREHETLRQAVAYMAANGFVIVPGEFRVI